MRRISKRTSSRYCSSSVSRKFELGERFDTYAAAKMELFDYLEVFYNQRRRHSTNGQISPAAFERRATAEAA
jgi:transposase InsO family protein